MSVESARACLRRLADDPEFMAQVKGAADADERRAIVHAAGFDFKMDELAEARSLELTDEESLKVGLADEEMDAMSGGVLCGVTHESEHCGYTHEEGHCGYTHEIE